MTDRITKYLNLWMLSGILLGGICGYYLPSVSLTLGFLGDLFLGGLKLLVIPMIVAGTISGVNAFGDVRRAGRFGGKVLGYFLCALIIAVLVGLIAVLVIEPGRGVGGVGQALVPNGWNTISEALGGLIPGNLVQAVSEGKYLGVVLLGLFLGGMLTAMGVKGRTAVTLFKNIHEGLLKVLALLLVMAPVGLFSLIGVAVAENQWPLGDGMAVAGSYLLTITLALLIHGFLLLPLAVWLLGQRSPFTFYRNLAPAFLTAFGTSNPIAAYPVAYRCLSERCQVDERATTLGLPLGSVINLQGTVICMIVATLFAAQMSPVEISFLQYLGVAAMAVLLSIGAAGIPSAVLLASPVLFGVVGLDAAGIALATGVVISLDWLVDRMRAVVNLAGDAAGIAVLAESFDLKTARRIGRERRPSRTGRSPRPGDRDQRSPRSDSRFKSRRPERFERSADPSRARGRRPAAATSETPTRTRGGRGRPTRSERSPFQMKTSSAPALGAEGGQAPDRRPAPQPAAELDSPPTTTPRKRTGRGSGPVGERRGRGRTRTPVDKPADAGRSAPPAKPTEPELAKSTPPAPESPKLETGAESSGERNGRLSPAIVARELAKVSAQLRQPEETESTDRPPVADKTPIAPDLTPAESALPEKVSEPVETVADQPPPEVVEDTHPDADDVIEPIAEASEGIPDAKPEEEPAPAFGRTKHKAGAAFRKKKAAGAEGEASKPEASQEQREDTASEPAEETPEPPAEGSPEGSAEETSERTVEESPEEPITFGRVKRKRTRR